MDLRNFSATPTQLDSMIQRRPSLSSLSSTSGYESSTYNPSSVAGAGAVGVSQIAHMRASAGPNRIYAGLSDDGPGAGLIVDDVQPLASDVGPWVEQQKQQQALDVQLGKKNGAAQVTLNSSNVDDSTIGVDDGDDDNDNNDEDEDDDDHNDKVNNDDDDDDDDENGGVRGNNGGDPDDLIPTAIVIKNIPFAIKKEQLLDVMTKLSLPLPYAFNYHFDNGVFRGLAFANFASTDETSMVVNNLNGREIGGRKLRVEYKKMLPLQERERIEREKREKRGQLEEQHRSGSTASLASLLSVTSTTAATKNLSVNGQTYPSQTERFFAQFPSSTSPIPLPPAELNFNDPEVLELYSQLLTYRDDNSKSVFELAFPSSLNMGQRKVLSLVCSFLNLLELFDNGLIIIRRKPGQQSSQQRQQQLANYNTHLHPQQSSTASAASVPQSQNIPASLAPALQSVGTPTQGNLSTGLSSHSSSMMNLNQMPALLYPNNLPAANVHQPELLRSQSQSALPLARSRQQTSTPVHQQQQHQNQQQHHHHHHQHHNQQQYSQYQNSGSHQQKGTQQNKYQNYGAFGGGTNTAPSHQQAQGSLGTPTSSSAAALLRTSNNRSFVDVRSSVPIGQSFQGSSAAGSPTPVHHTSLYQQPGNYYMGGQGTQISQPTTPHQTTDLSNRFAPFGQHLSGGIASLQATTPTNEDYALSDPLNAKLSNLNLNNGYEQQKGSGIWGPRK